MIFIKRFFGVLFFILAFTFIVTTEQVHPNIQICFIAATFVCIVFALFLLRKTKKDKQKSDKKCSKIELQNKNTKYKTADPCLFSDITLSIDYPIKYNSTPPSKLYDITTDEMLFFKELSSKLTEKENKMIILRRMSDGALEPYYNGYPLGKIKLQGQKLYMQRFKSLYQFDSIYGTVYEFINEIDNIILYLRKYCK